MLDKLNPARRSICRCSCVLLTAVVLGALVGYERERAGKPGLGADTWHGLPGRGALCLRFPARFWWCQ